MNSRGTPRFWAAYRELPEPVREAARKAYRLGYRAVGLLEQDEVTWLWIGSHADYDRLLKAF